jgi:hypothetical protein
MRFFVVHDDEGQIVSVVAPAPELEGDLEFESEEGTVLVVSEDDIEGIDASSDVPSTELMASLHDSHRVDSSAGRLVRVGSKGS